MNRLRIVTIRASLLMMLSAVCLVAQPQIGGGTCSSASLSGNYAVSITGSQVTASGTFSSVFAANGMANFDGLNKVTFTLTADTLQGAGTPITWSGTYSMQSNCAGVANITSGGTVTLNLAVFNQGSNFLVTGSDANYGYSGGGNLQPTACSTALLTGTYLFNATGFSRSSTAVTGSLYMTGSLQFDGQGHLTANWGLSSAGQAATQTTASGSYSMSANCLGTATLSDSQGNSYTLTLSVYAGNSTATSQVYVVISAGSKILVSGAAHAVGADTCSTASLNGTYSMVLNGRNISPAGAFNGSFQSNGLATFDGNGNVTYTGTANTNLAQGTAITYSGTYNIPASCAGTLSFNSGAKANFNLIVWSTGKLFSVTGSDASYGYSGSGQNVRPQACATSSISGEYTYTAAGFTHSGTAQNGSAEELGVLQFDGQGNVTGNATTVSAAGSPATTTSTGTYSVNANCTGTATMTDSNGKSNALTFTVTNTYGQAVDMTEANSSFVRTGTAHSAFTNPTQAIGNVASYAVNATPAGSVFVLFGNGLASRPAQAANVPLPKTLNTTSVTVNGEPAPLFYVDPNQVDAQMPWDIPGGTVATVIVKNGNATSNAAAVYVPATGTPGISVYSNNRAVVVNAGGKVNSPSTPAKVGEEVVAYFTGGGAVNSSTPLVTGAAAPGTLLPLSGNSTVTVGTVPANVKYIGLTPGSVGLYQANFIVPTLAKGSYAVVISIDGTASNGPVMSVSD